MRHWCLQLASGLPLNRTITHKSQRNRLVWPAAVTCASSSSCQVSCGARRLLKARWVPFVWIWSFLSKFAEPAVDHDGTSDSRVYCIYIYNIVMSFSGFLHWRTGRLDDVSLLIPTLPHTLLTEAKGKAPFVWAHSNLSLGGPGTDTRI